MCIRDRVGDIQGKRVAAVEAEFVHRAAGHVGRGIAEAVALSLIHI
mgnify:CR=1 FL=1